MATINTIRHAIKIIIRLAETLRTSLLTLANSIYITIMPYNYPFLFQCLKFNLQVPFRFFEFVFQTKKCLKSKLSGNNVNAIG